MIYKLSQSFTSLLIQGSPGPIETQGLLTTRGFVAQEDRTSKATKEIIEKTFISTKYKITALFYHQLCTNRIV